VRKLTHEEISARRMSPEAVGGPPGRRLSGFWTISAASTRWVDIPLVDGAFIQELLLPGTPRGPQTRDRQNAWGTETVPWAYYRNPSTP